MEMNNTMVHAGLPLSWVIAVGVISLLIVTRALLRAPAPLANDSATAQTGQRASFAKWFRNPWPQVVLRITVALLFLLVIYSGIAGTPIPERNFATVITWGFWWTGLILFVLFAGTAWCAACPWDSLAQWLVRRRWWQRGDSTSSMNLRVPGWLRSVWPASLMFVGFTWLELGFGITRSPYGTAMLALLMLVLATTSMALFERKAFCRYFCPVGRTIGVYSQLAPVELRPLNADTCARCQTLECYHGTEQVEPCPTRLVMGRFHQNTYCTSCGACIRSCPHQNVSLQMRGFASEIKQQARPHLDEAWFMLILLALTSFHGVTMMAFWGKNISQFARSVGDSGSLLVSFSLFMILFMVAVVLFFILFWKITSVSIKPELRHMLFSRLAFTAIPLAFAYHLSHNVGHLFRESTGTGSVWLNPTGAGTLPLSAYDIQCRMESAMIVDSGIHAVQALLILTGLYLAVEVLRKRMSELYLDNSPVVGIKLLPMLLFVVGASAFNLWLLMNPMVMRY